MSRRERLLTSDETTMIKGKRKGAGLEMRTYLGNDRRTYLVFRTDDGGFHTFVETEAKQAARECGTQVIGNTRQMWSALWKEQATR
jgi:hypothetical protein